MILAGTGEADNSADSYFGLGILRSADGGITWNLIPTANGGTLSFSGLGATRIAFSIATGQTNTVVAAMAAAAEGVSDGALTTNTERGLYTSSDAGQTWTYDALFSGGASEATSATSVVYNAAANNNAGSFFAALRYHGFYSSPDGITWTRLANQPGAVGLLSTTACPQNYSTACPIYRGEISVVAGRNEMYAWFISLDSNNNPVDQGIWLSTNGGTSWVPINDTGIANCGDFNGCGGEQAYYNMELLAIPNGSSATDLYAGAVNIYKCSISLLNPTCASAPFLNLTHVYGCNPISAPSHLHPDQHALAYTIPSGSAASLMYFANDGGIYRALNGASGLSTGSCSGTNQFDDLNQNLGSMTQFVSFSQHPTNADLMLGGTQDNGSPATAAATTSSSWGNVLGGDGGYNAIDPNTGNFFASNPDFPAGAGALNILECGSGVNCTTNLFGRVVGSSELGGDDGAFYFPYILDQSPASLLIGTCRVWRGPRAGGTYSALSLNFETFGTGICSGSEVNVVSGLAAGGPTDSNGSLVIYATTSGLGPNGPPSPSGGHVWVTTNAAAVSGISSTFRDVTGNGPSGSINPNQYPVSSVAIDSSDSSGNTAYVTVMGFTGGPGHVWRTTNAGASWLDFTGIAPSALPDSPVNAVVVDPVGHVVYVGTDVGVFQTTTSSAAWSEVGPLPNSGLFGFLPNVAVTALALFNSGGQKILRASTYGRGIWQSSLIPDFRIAVSNTPLTVFAGAPATFIGTLTAVGGYNSLVQLTCTPGSSQPPSPCIPNPLSVTPSPAGTPFTVSTGSNIGDYGFHVLAAGTDPNSTTHFAAVTLHVVNFGMTPPVPSSVSDPRGAASAPVSFQVTAQGSFNQSVTLTCSFAPVITGAACNFLPGAVVNPTSSSPVSVTATATVPSTTAAGNYTVTLQAATAGSAAVTTSFTLIVTTNPDFVLSEPSPFPNVKVGSTGTTGPIAISSQDGFSGTVTLSCVTTFGANSCSVSPASVNSFPATVNLIIEGTSFTTGSYQVAVQGVSGADTHSLEVPFNVGDYVLAGPSAFSAAPGGQAIASLTLTSSNSYAGQVTATCDASSLPGAQCTLGPPNPITVASGAVVGATATINVPNDATPAAYKITINTQDVSGAPSHALVMTLNVLQDYTLANFSPPSQTISAGQSATYNFSVLPVGAAYTNAVTLSCSGTPLFPGSCSFTPNPAGPLSNSTGASVVMTVTTPTKNERAKLLETNNKSWWIAFLLSAPGVLLTGSRRKKSGSRTVLLAMVLCALFLLPSCGGGTNSGATSPGGNVMPTTYTITIIGSPPSISQPNGTTVTLTVQ